MSQYYIVQNWKSFKQWWGRFHVLYCNSQKLVRQPIVNINETGWATYSKFQRNWWGNICGLRFKNLPWKTPIFKPSSNSSLAIAGITGSPMMDILNMNLCWYMFQRNFVWCLNSSCRWKLFWILRKHSSRCNHNTLTLSK